MSTFYPAHGESEPFQEEPGEGQVANEIVLPDPALAPEEEAEESGAAEEADAGADADPGAASGSDAGGDAEKSDAEKPADA